MGTEIGLTLVAIVIALWASAPASRRKGPPFPWKDVIISLGLAALGLAGMILTWR